MIEVYRLTLPHRLWVWDIATQQSFWVNAETGKYPSASGFTPSSVMVVQCGKRVYPAWANPELQLPEGL